MVDPRTISKTTLPTLTRVISRPRLVQRIEGASARVILITGQAAQGKSTLAAQIIRPPGSLGAWMHLDAADSDPANCFHLLVHALTASQRRRDISGFLKNPAIALGPEAGLDRILERTDRFLETVAAREPIRIVIDGLDQLSEDADSLVIINRLIYHIQPPGCLILVSRKTPALKLESLRIRQELVVIDNADLAFSTDEISRFFSKLYGLQLATPQLAMIHKVTDGWAGGLVLVWEALSHIPEDQRAAFIDKGLPAAMQGDRLAYFSEAVFGSLDASIRNFLIRSAIFETIEPKMIARYMQDQTGGEVDAIIRTMVRQNVFIHPLYDEKAGWGYRYNQLFRDFLIDKFHRELDTQSQQALVARAADLAWDAGKFEEAIRFFLQAKAYEKAAAGIKKIAMRLSAQGRFSDLAGWIDTLPDAMVEDDAWLCFYRAVGRRISGGRRNIQAFSTARDRFAANGDQRGQLLALANLIETAVFIGHSAADLRRWLQDGWDLLKRVSGNRYFPFAKATLWMQVAFGYISGVGDLKRGLSACRNAMLLANTIEDETLTVNATIIHVFGFTMAGEFTAAEKALATIQELVATAYPEYRSLRNLVRIKLALAKGDLANARRLLDVNQEEIDRFGLLFLYPIHVDVTGLLQIHQRRFDALGRTAHHLKDVATLTANPLYHGLSLRLRAFKAYHQGHYKRACMWAEKAIEVIDQSLGDSIHLFRCRLILGMATYHQGDTTGARQALQSACDFFERVSSHLSLVEARLGLSLVARTMDDTPAADRHLEAAMTLAAAKAYNAFPILSADDILAACTPARRHPSASIARLSRHLTERLSPPIPSTVTDNQARGHAPVRRRPASPATDPARFDLDIHTLGGFEVRRNGGETITDAQWTGLRQKLLLKAILVNGCREIPKDILMDALWPDSSHEAALKRFKVTLHRLRKILDPATPGRTGTSCISLKDNLVSLDMRRCRVDVNDFLAACDAIRQVKRDDDDHRLIKACRRAVTIYRGEFLPEEPYLSWAVMKRAALQDQYLAVRMQMATLFERMGDLEQAVRHCRAVIRIDPLAEQAHQQLMRLLQRQGRRSAALKAYRKLVNTLATELDTVPDPETTQIFTEIENGR